MEYLKIVRDKIKKEELKEIAKNTFGNLVKAVIDVEREIMAIGGELHSDEEALLIEDGSKYENLWGINLYPEVEDENWIEFDSLINIRPSQGNFTRNIDNPYIREKIIKIIK
ncbi:MAG: DUF5674 family protein, partial [candidate division WOR-3 bacterium]